MSRRNPIVGLVLVAVGAIWIGQGLGLIRGGSFMVGDVRWAVAGVVMAVVGGVLLARAMLHRHR